MKEIYAITIGLTSNSFNKLAGATRPSDGACLVRDRIKQKEHDYNEVNINKYLYLHTSFKFNQNTKLLMTILLDKGVHFDFMETAVNYKSLQMI